MFDRGIAARGMPCLALLTALTLTACGSTTIPPSAAQRAGAAKTQAEAAVQRKLVRTETEEALKRRREVAAEVSKTEQVDPTLVRELEAREAKERRVGAIEEQKEKNEER